jgi:hypothetical protein
MTGKKRIDLRKFVKDPELFFKENLAEKVILEAIGKDDPPVEYEDVIFMINDMSQFCYLIDKDGKLHQIPSDRVLEVVRSESFISLWKRLQLATIADTINQLVALENSLNAADSRVDF